MVSDVKETFDYDATVIRRLEEGGAILAAKLAMPLTGDRAIMGDMATLARNMINSAWETDANEGLEEELPDADWIQARA